MNDRKKMEYIFKNLGYPALMEQLAEECAELSHACLKLARVEREENPTPCTWDEAFAMIQEEVNDVMLCIHVLGLDEEIKYKDQAKKMERWVERINESNYRRSHA